MASMSYWIMERDNPQLGVYYVARGQLSKSKAHRKEVTLYGSNTMHEYKTEDEYKQALEILKANGESVHED